MGDKDDMTGAIDKESRKQARRKRIEARKHSGDSDNEVNEGGNEIVMKSGAQQVADSFLHLDRRKETGLKEVTKVRIEIDAGESQRRVNDENLRRERLTKLQREAFTSAKANAAIEMKWAELLEQSIPQALHHEIKNQMDACQKVIQSKDDIISEFQKQLRSKDEEYVKSLRSQAEDVESLMKRIRSEFAELSCEYNKELEAIEDAFVEERDRQIADQTSEVDGLFEKRKTNENIYRENKQKREEQFQKEIEELLTQGSDKYNKLKIELEMNIQTLKQQLEEIKATYQLNTEKLDYNYRVLTELDVEKSAELARYKRRLTKLKDQLSHFVTKFHEMETADNKMNNDLTEDYRRLTSKYKNLQSKFRYFEVSDTHKYEEVWSMHEEEAKDMVDQLLKADKILTEQQLGLAWAMPEDLSLLQDGMKAGTPALTPAVPEEEKEEGAGTGTGRKVSATRVRAVLKLIAREAGFMLNQAVQDSIESLPEDEGSLVQAEGILKILGVKSEAKMAALVDYFFCDTSQGETVLAARDHEAQIEDVEGEHMLGQHPDDFIELKDMITAEDVIAACKIFIEDVSDAPMGATSNQSEGASKRRQLALKAYWNNLANIVSDETVEVWTQLESDCEKLQDIITRRANTIAEVDSLTARNAKLKRLLNQYLGDRKNDYMQIPPAQTMRVRDVNVKRGASKKFGAKTGGGVTGKADGPLMSATQ
jgi:dynein regulatry complex protein 1